MTVTRLSYHYFNYPPMMFDIVSQYPTLGYFLSAIIVICLFLYFITSSNSGSLVDTVVGANGIPEPAIPQRIWWSLTEGISAAGLMYSSLFNVADKKGNMKALQAASFATGLPYTFLVCGICGSIWKTLKNESFDDHSLNGFRTSCMDIGLALHGGKVGTNPVLSFSGPKFDRTRIEHFFKNLVCPLRCLSFCAQEACSRTG